MESCEDWAGVIRSTDPIVIMSTAERATATDNGHESDESSENAKLLGQLDACVQLMQRGSLLLVFHTQVCAFDASSRAIL